MKEEILKVTRIAVGANVSGTVAKRSGGTSSQLLGDGSGEEPTAFLFQSQNDPLWNAMVDHLEDSVLFAGSHHLFR